MSKPGARGAPAATAPPKPPPRERLREAMTHAAAGRFDRAEALFREVLAERPTEADALYGLGRVLSIRGDHEAAVAQFDRAIASRPKRAPYHAARADALHHLDRSAASLASARRAVALDPSCLSGHSMAAVAHFRMNRLEEAGAAADKALAIAPSDANAGLIRARIDVRRGDAQAARATIERTLADPALPPLLRRVALHDLGEALHQLGVRDDAFAAWAQSGRAQLESPEATRIDRRHAHDVVDAYRASTTTASLARARDVRPEDGLPAPAFLVGFPRSGTTMTEQIMAAHPDITTSDEEDILGRVRVDLESRDGGVDLARRLAHVDAGTVRAGRAAYWGHVEERVGHRPGRGLFVDKLPLNLVHLPLINAIFPQARVIVALRDPRDVCLSCFRQWFGLNHSMIQFLTIEDTARYYAKVMDYWLHLRPMLPMPFLEVRYEDTVNDLEGQARRILDHLGVGWDAGVLAFHEKARKRYITTPSFAAVTEKVHTRAIGGWRSYEKQLAPVLPVLERFVEAFGYGGVPC